MEDMDDMRTAVELYVYDLTRGMAAVMSQILIGRHLDGVWHTAIVAYGREYFFGPAGIQSVRPVSMHTRTLYACIRVICTYKLEQNILVI